MRCSCFSFSAEPCLVKEMLPVRSSGGKTALFEVPISISELHTQGKGKKGSEMDNSEKLDAAGAAMARGRGDEAIELYKSILNSGGEYVPHAYRGLALIYEHGIGVEHDFGRAKELYLRAESEGGPTMSYYIGRLHQKQREFKEAIECFKKVSDTNPSSAYWAYRHLSEDPSLQSYEGEAKEYLETAALLGHVHARKQLILGRLKGWRGMLSLPGAGIEYVRLILQTRRAVKDGDHFLYT